jgi:hypothetical protein
MPLREAINITLNTFLLYCEINKRYPPATRRDIKSDLTSVRNGLRMAYKALQEQPNVRMYGPDPRNLLPPLKEWIDQTDLTIDALQKEDVLPGQMAPKDGAVAPGQQTWHHDLHQDPEDWLIFRLCEGYEEAFQHQVTDDDDGPAAGFIRPIVQQVNPSFMSVRRALQRYLKREREGKSVQQPRTKPHQKRSPRKNPRRKPSP